MPSPAKRSQAGERQPCACPCSCACPGVSWDGQEGTDDPPRTQSDSRWLGWHGGDRLQEFVRLHRMGTSTREVARLLGMGRNTEKQYREALARAGLLKGALKDLPELTSALR